jgi:hemin uptake protein HemP
MIDKTTSVIGFKRPIPGDMPLAVSDTPADAGLAGTVALNSQDLLRGRKTITIEHNGEHYRLQSTRSGKLILTK